MAWRNLACLIALGVRLTAAQTGDPAQACSEIESQMTGSGIMMNSLLNADFRDAMNHWLLSSAQDSTCVIEAGSPEDVATAMTVIAKHRVPFAVKSGGHASIQGFSSTTGVHLSLKQFNQTVLSPDNSTIEIGFGLTWAEVFERLDGGGGGPRVNVVGGRTSGPGVGGFTLGGGYSWKTNQFGLASDNVKQFNIVLPNATMTTASAENNQDMFWALKGGLNRFGIVTSAVYNTHPQTDVYGGIALYPEASFEAVIKATQTFYEVVKDPKAQIITTMNILPAVGLSLDVIFLYDGPDPGNTFQMFDSIDSTLSLLSRKTFSDLVGTLDSTYTPGLRGSFNTLPTTNLTQGYLDAILDQARALANVSSEHSGEIIAIDVEPFMNYGQHATESAWEHADSQLPLNLAWSWLDADEDQFWIETQQKFIDNLKQVAVQEGIYDEKALTYTNYAPASATAEQVYGAANLAKMRSIRDSIDPDRIMDLAGGFAI